MVWNNPVYITNVHGRTRVFEVETTLIANTPFNINRKLCEIHVKEITLSANDPKPPFSFYYYIKDNLTEHKHPIDNFPIDDFMKMLNDLVNAGMENW